MSNLIQNAKFVSAIKPAAVVNNASATADAIDTRGYSHCTIVLQLGATDIAMSALKVQSSTTSGGTYTDITGATFDGGSGVGGATLALPSATDDGQTCAFQIDMRGKNPFLKVVATFGNGSTGGFIAGSAILTHAALAPSTSTGMADGDVCRV